MPWTLVSLWASALLQCVSVPQLTTRTAHRGVCSTLESSATHCSPIFVRNRKMSFFCSRVAPNWQTGLILCEVHITRMWQVDYLPREQWQHRRQFESWMENTWGISWGWLAISIPSALSPRAENDAAAPGLSPQNYLLSSWQCWSCAYT